MSIMMRNEYGEKKVNTMLRPVIDQKNNGKLFFNECLKRRRTVRGCRVFESFSLFFFKFPRPTTIRPCERVAHAHWKRVGKQFFFLFFKILFPDDNGSRALCPTCDVH